MKKYFFVFSVLLLMTIGIRAQNYQITFSGSGMSTTVTSVKVWNLTHDTTFTMSGTDTLVLTEPIGVLQPESQKLFAQVFPNPASGKGSATFTNPQSGTVNAEFFNLQGKVVLTSSDFLPEGKHTFSFGGLSQGTYLIRFTTSNKTATTKWISMGQGSGTPYLRLEHSYKLPVSGAKLASERSAIQIPYNAGDILMFRGSSGNYARIVTLAPTQSQIVDFEFIACTDGSNYHYPVVTIGTQTWMATNLRTAKYNNGTNIPKITDNNSWSNTTTPAFCWYDNDSAGHAVPYGALYKWYAVATGNLCPTGWHVPTVAEWNTLTQYLGGDTLAGGKMKETGTAHWDTLFAGTTNLSGFTAVPAGIRQITNGNFSDIGLNNYFWTATDYSASFAHIRHLTYNSNKLSAVGNNKGNGFSVRCIKD
jgi:uncharacterized protein (TIGR02145 family)